MIHMILHAIFGLIIGLLARAILPGGQRMGLILTMILGLIGAWLGGVIGRMTGMYREGHPAGFFMALIGALIVVYLYSLAVVRTSPASRPDPAALGFFCRATPLLLGRSLLRRALLRRVITLLDRVGLGHELAFLGLAVPAIAFAVVHLGAGVHPHHALGRRHLGLCLSRRALLSRATHRRLLLSGRSCRRRSRTRRGRLGGHRGPDGQERRDLLEGRLVHAGLREILDGLVRASGNDLLRGRLAHPWKLLQVRLARRVDVNLRSRRRALAALSPHVQRGEADEPDDQQSEGQCAGTYVRDPGHWLVLSDPCVIARVPRRRCTSWKPCARPRRPVKNLNSQRPAAVSRVCHRIARFAHLYWSRGSSRMKWPVRRSRRASSISARVFITNGP